MCLQSTYCDHLRQHCEAVGRTVHTVNLGELPSSPCNVAVHAWSVSGLALHADDSGLPETMVTGHDCTQASFHNRATQLELCA